VIRRAILRATTIVFFLLGSYVHASSPVWKVSNGESYLYVGGTFHVLSASDHPLPTQFDHAYRQATHVVLETDMATLESPAFAQKTMMALMYTDGRTLQSELKPTTYSALMEYFSKRGIPPANMALFKPAGVALTIQVLEYQLLGMTKEAGVDRVFSTKAKQDGKQLGQLETPDEQLAFIRKMGEGKEDEIILHTLKEAETLPRDIVKLKRAWRGGDNKYMEKIATEKIQAEFPEMYDILLKNRNDAWLPKIENMLKNKEVELVLVGAMHLVGKDGLIKQFKRKGYKVENL